MYKNLVIACEDVREIEFGELANVEFVDPNDSRKTYCVGFRYLRGDRYDVRNWDFDHVNHWQSNRADDFIRLDETEFRSRLSQENLDLDKLILQVLDFRR